MIGTCQVAGCKVTQTVPHELRLPTSWTCRISITVGDLICRFIAWCILQFSWPRLTYPCTDMKQQKIVNIKTLTNFSKQMWLLLRKDRLLLVSCHQWQTHLPTVMQTLPRLNCLSVCLYLLKSPVKLAKHIKLNYNSEMIQDRDIVNTEHS